MRRPTRTRLRQMRLLAAVGCLLLPAACRPAAREHRVLESSVETLRSDFVADSGAVRAIFLASPT